MIDFTRGVLALIAGAALALAIAAPAHATLTPVNSNVAGGAGQVVFTIDLGGGFIDTVTCRSTTVDGRTNGTGTAVNAHWFFHSLPCREGLFGVSVTLASTGFFTFAVTSSTAGANASADFSFDRSFQLTFYNLFCNYTFRGPQGPFPGAVTFDQATQSLTIALSGLAVTGSGCTPVGGSFSGTFTMSPRVTVS